VNGRRVAAAVGLLIGLAGIATLAWNELRLARQFAALDSASSSAVYVVGEAVAATPLRDPDFGLVVDGLRLERKAETFQWLERREGTGSNKSLRYEKVWSPVLIPWRRFEERSTHLNPEALPVSSFEAVASDARLFGEPLDPALLRALPATRELRPEQTGAVHLGDRRFKRAGDWLYSGDPRNPEIGDVRLRFASAPEGRVSLLAAREDGRIVPYAAASGGSVALAAYGEVPAATLLADAARADWRDAWALRGFATMLVLLGTLFAMPELGARLRAAGRPHGVRVMLLIGFGTAAAACALSWIAARLLLAVI
jgi:Transmembrane protein 43